MFKIYSIILLITATSLTTFGCTPANKQQKITTEVDSSKKYRNLIRDRFVKKAKKYHADTRYLLLVDYSIPSNQDRFFVWDNEQGKIIERFWCAHGFGRNSTAEKPEFSNALGSYCSSLGWFLVDRSVGESVHYGYKFHAVDGLDKQNSNARRRQLLIHPWPSVSYDERMKIQQPMDLDYRSAGCFTTSARGYRFIDMYIKKRTRPLLLYAIY